MLKTIILYTLLASILFGCSSETEEKSTTTTQNIVAGFEDSIDKYIGRYEDEFDVGVLNIYKNGSFNIEIATAKCTGEASGVIKFKSNTTAIYDTQNCKLTFTFNDANTMNVKQEQCTDQIGAMCTFEGNYTKPSIDVGVMVGQMYAGYCSFSTPADDKAFIFDDEKTWKYIFSSDADGKVASIMLNGKVIRLTLTDTIKESKLNRLIENYTFKAGDIEVKIIKQQIDKAVEHTKYKGEMIVKKAGEHKTLTFVGDCGV